MFIDILTSQKNTLATFNSLVPFLPIKIAVPRTETINDKFIAIYLIHSNTNRKKGTEVITQTRGQHGEILSLIYKKKKKHIQRK